MNEPTRTRHTSQLVPMNAAPPTNFLIYTLSAGRTAKIKKIMLMNNTGVNDLVIFGEMVTIPPAPAAFVARLPAVYVLTPFDEQLHEWQIPKYEFETDIYATSANAAPGTTLDVLIEVEEVG